MSQVAYRYFGQQFCYKIPELKIINKQKGNQLTKARCLHGHAPSISPIEPQSVVFSKPYIRGLIKLLKPWIWPFRDSSSNDPKL